MKTCSPHDRLWRAGTHGSRTKSASWSRRDGNAPASRATYDEQRVQLARRLHHFLGRRREARRETVLDDRTVGEHGDQKVVVRIEVHHCTLKIVALARAMRRRRPRCSSSSGSTASRSFQDLFDLAAHAGEELITCCCWTAPRTPDCDGPRVAIALVGRDRRPTCGAGRGSPLALGRPSQSARSPKRRRGRARRHRRGADRLGGVDVFDDDGLKCRFSGVEVHDNLRGCATTRRAILSLVSSQFYRVLMPPRRLDRVVAWMKSPDSRDRSHICPATNESTGSWLAFYRATLLKKCWGSPSRISVASVATSSMSLLGILDT